MNRGMIKLEHIPMPPIANHRLMPSKGRLIKSPDARDFDKAIQVWMLRQKSALFDYRRKARDMIVDLKLFSIKLDFYWPKESLVSKNGVPKKIDLDGRIKSAIDAVSIIIDQDDKYVIKIEAHKLIWNKIYSEFNAEILPINWNA